MASLNRLALGRLLRRRNVIPTTYAYSSFSKLPSNCLRAQNTCWQFSPVARRNDRIDKPWCSFSTSSRNCCQSENSKMEVKFEELQDLLSSKSVVLVDVREPKELSQDGKIPGSINVPLGEVETAFLLAAPAFESKYGSSLPEQDASHTLVFTCRSGRRATTALEAAKKVGFENARCYCGSFLDWSEKGGPLEKQ